MDTEVGQALDRMRQHNITVLNQTVLLQGINDCPSILARLSEQLFNHGVLPYYLHILDRVNGAAHFELEQARIQQIYTQLLKALPASSFTRRGTR